MAHTYAGAPDARQAEPGAAAEAPSRFRPRYRTLSPEELAAHDAIKAEAERLEALFMRIAPGRYRALAVTALEESIMWAVKELTGSGLAEAAGDDMAGRAAAPD